MSKLRSLWPALVLTIALAMLLAACGPAGTPTPEPTPTRPLRPTFTPTIVPTDTPMPTDTPLPTDTPTPLPTDTPTPATPKAIVGGDGQVNVRSGPGTAYVETGEVATGSELEIVAKNAAGDWYQVCCVDGAPAWIVARLVEVTGDPNLIQVAANIPAPPTATRAPTRPAAPPPTRPPAAPPPPTATPAPAYLFDPQSGGAARINTNPVVTFWGLLLNQAGNKVVTGYNLVVQGPVSDTRPFEPFEMRGDPGIAGSEFIYNAKVEFIGGPAGVYRAWVADPGGNQVSEAQEFTVQGETRTFFPRWKQR